MTKLSEHYSEMAGRWCGNGGSHIRLQKHVADDVLKIIVPAHKPVKRSTLSHIIKQVRLSTEEFLALL
jgi:hypothetical protein